MILLLLSCVLTRESFSVCIVMLRPSWLPLATCHQPRPKWFVVGRVDSSSTSCARPSTGRNINKASVLLLLLLLRLRHVHVCVLMSVPMAWLIFSGQRVLKCHSHMQTAAPMTAISRWAANHEDDDGESHGRGKEEGSPRSSGRVFIMNPISD